MKEDVDALHAASSEMLGRSSELSSTYRRSCIRVTHLMQVKLDTKNPRCPNRLIQQSIPTEQIWLKLRASQQLTVERHKL